MKRRSGFGWLELTAGILLVILGIRTFVHPGSAISGVVIVYGITAVLTGIADMVFYIKMEQHTGFGPTISLISGILSVMAGIMLLVYPDALKWILTLLLPVWFIAHCISRLSHLHMIRITAGNLSYLFSLIVNVLGVILGFLMILNPFISLLSMDWIIGIYLILIGIESILMGLGRLGAN
ncbi:MAG: HdeD family acid-resistance protein [Fusicatenibacter sp.]|nr:DUF308 domain-containing protein [Fusicatenibacter sp.]